MSHPFLALLVLGFLPLPLLAQSEFPANGSLPKAEFRADVVPAIVEIEVLLAEWTAGADGAAPKMVSELSGPTTEIMQRITAMEKQGQLTGVQRIRLATVDGHGALAQQGERRPRVTATSITPRGAVNSIVYEEVGTSVSVVPHVHTGDAVTLELNISKSTPRLRADSPVLSETPMGDKIRSESRASLTLSTAVRLANGQIVVVAGAVGKDDRYLALVAVKVVK